jgi:hypothetical protein
VKLSPGVLFGLAIAAIVAAGTSQVFAQATGPRPGSNGLFGGGNSDASARQRLDLTLSSTEGYDSDLVPRAGTAVGSGGPDQTGYSTMLAGVAEYAWQIRRVRVRATGSSTLRYLPPLDDVVYSSSRSVSHSEGVGIFARLPKQTSVLVNQTATYSPSFLYNLFPRAPATVPGDAPPAAPDYATSGYESHAYETVTTLTHDFTRRSSVLATADYQNTETRGETTGRRALSSFGISGRFSHRLGPNTAATAEYLYRNSEFARADGVTTGETLADHGVNIGVDYNRRLSASRHFTLGALVGVSTTILPESALPESPEGLGSRDRYYHRMSGQVTMGYEFGRTWMAGAIYRRGVDYVAGLIEPISADRFTASAEGLLARRIDVLVSAGYSNGVSAVSQNSTFDTYTGDVRLRYALTRTFAAYVEYLYYFYDSRGSTPIAPGVSSGLERKGVRTGLTLLVPALRR